MNLAIPRREGFSFNTGGWRSLSLTVGPARPQKKVTNIICCRWISPQIAWFCCVLGHALRLRWRFAWQAQYFRSMSQAACCFSCHGQHFVLLHRRFSWQAQHLKFGDVAKVLFSRIAVSRLRKDDTVSKVVAGVGRCAKIILFELCQNSFIRKTRRKSSIFSFKVSKLEEISHEMLFLALQTNCGPKKSVFL